jgi:hypothetical protein
MTFCFDIRAQSDAIGCCNLQLEGSGLAENYILDGSCIYSLQINLEFLSLYDPVDLVSILLCRTAGLLYALQELKRIILQRTSLKQIGVLFSLILRTEPTDCEIEVSQNENIWNDVNRGSRTRRLTMSGSLASVKSESKSIRSWMNFSSSQSLKEGQVLFEKFTALDRRLTSLDKKLIGSTASLNEPLSFIQHQLLLHVLKPVCEEKVGKFV